MIIWLDDELFSGKVTDTDCLTLLRQAAVRRHTLLISNNPLQLWSGVAPFFVQWCATLNLRLQNEVGMLLERLRMVSGNAITRSHAKPICVTHRSIWALPDQCLLRIEDAIRAVSLPLQILVENQINDAAFIRCVMPPYWQKKLAEWELNGELRYIQGGGITEIRNLIEFHAEDHRSNVAFGLPAKMWQVLHFIIYDHDGNSANNPSIDSKAVEMALDNVGMKMRGHRLWRQKQENYLPQNILIEIAKSKITDSVDLNDMLSSIRQRYQNIDHFSQLPRICKSGKTSKKPFFKNEFAKNTSQMQQWQSREFEADGAWPEMTILAEAIAAAM